MTLEINGSFLNIRLDYKSLQTKNQHFPLPTNWTDVHQQTRVSMNGSSEFGLILLN